MTTRLPILAALLLAACGGGGGPPPAPVCGDGVAQEGEACDGADLGGQDCAGLGQGFVGGTLACGPACTLVTAACQLPGPVCGDGVAQAGEACDGADLGGQGCASLGQGFVGGTLGCDAACRLVTTGCDRAPGTCGNGVVDGDEACDDGNALDLDGCSATCQLEQPNSGWLAPGGGIGECCGT